MNYVRKGMFDMSWGIEITGSKEGVKKQLAAQLDKIAAGYEGKEEAKDILVAKERLSSLVDACDCTPDAYFAWNGVVVKASGSHSINDKGVVNASMNLSVTRTNLALE